MIRLWTIPSHEPVLCVGMMEGAIVLADSSLHAPANYMHPLLHGGRILSYGRIHGTHGLPSFLLLCLSLCDSRRGLLLHPSPIPCFPALPFASLSPIPVRLFGVASVLVCLGFPCCSPCSLPFRAASPGVWPAMVEVVRSLTARVAQGPG